MARVARFILEVGWPGLGSNRCVQLPRDQGWSLEVAIPWRNFEELAPRPTAGTTWTANLNRWDGVEPDRCLSVWSDPLQDRPNPHAPARFGKLVFVADRQ